MRLLLLVWSFVLLLSGVFLVEGAAPPIVPSPAIAVIAARDDARKFSYLDRIFIRYLWVPEEGRNRAFLRAASKLNYNLLSRDSEIQDVVEVTPWLWRIDVRDVRWRPSIWEEASRVDVFFHERFKAIKSFRKEYYWPGGYDRKGKFWSVGKYQENVKVGDVVDYSARWLPTKEIVELRKLLYTEVPILHAGWFLAQSSRQVSLRNKQTGIGYYDFLELKKRNDYFRLLGFNERVSKNIYREMRAALELSGISPQNRQIVRFQGASGGVWVTLDTSNQSGRGVAIQNLRDGEFKHEAEEWYGFLPNDLPATFLSDDKGVRQDFAPGDKLGLHDDSVLNESRDKRIHINLGCIRCHAGNILQPIDDYIRKTHRNALGLGAKKREDVLAARRQYFSDITKRLNRDVIKYAEKFTEATITPDFPKGLTPQRAVEIYARAYHAYADDKIYPEDAARELGVTKNRLMDILEWHHKNPKKVDLRLSPFLVKPKPLPISRLTWEDVYDQAQLLVAGYLQDR